MHCDVLYLQETHRGSKNNRPRIQGMVLAAERPHRQYGSAIFVKIGSVIEATSISEERNIEVLTVELSRIVITSVYKPPAEYFSFTDPVPTSTKQTTDHHWRL